MSQSLKKHRSSSARRRSHRESVTTAVGIAAERATLAARERDVTRARAAAHRLSATPAAGR